MKEIIAPIRIEKIIENPMDTPSIFTKNKSNEIIFGLRLMNIKKNVMRLKRGWTRVLFLKICRSTLIAMSMNFHTNP